MMKVNFFVFRIAQSEGLVTKLGVSTGLNLEGAARLLNSGVPLLNGKYALFLLNAVAAVVRLCLDCVVIELSGLGYPSSEPSK